MTYKEQVLRELMRYHEAISDFYDATAPHTKVESDLFLNLEDIYRDVVHTVRWGDEKDIWKAPHVVIRDNESFYAKFMKGEDNEED